MVDKKFIEYGRKLRAQGRTEEQVTAALINSDGLTDEQVAEVLAEAFKGPVDSVAQTAATAAKPTEEAQPKKGWWPF